jgi:hypothetical protein
MNGADPELYRAIEAVKDQLLIVFVNRLGGELRVPIEEVDGTGQFLLHMEVDGRGLRFRVSKKQ